MILLIIVCFLFQDKNVKKGTLKDNSKLFLQDEQVIRKVLKGLSGTRKDCWQDGQGKTRFVMGFCL